MSIETQNSLLIVDDDASNLMELASILKPEYKIYAVKDGKPALEKAHEALPDLILLDVVMPDMNGFDVLAELKKSERTKNIPVIFITGVNDSESEREGLSIGAVDYIRKPFNSMVVQHRVRLQIQILNLQRDLENAADIARAANQSKSSFLANMSHEIRTPMNAIMGITDILLQEENTKPEDVTEGLNKIYNSSEMLLNLINDILDFSKIEAGKLDILPTRYRLANLISDTVQLNMMRIGEKPITFEIDIMEDIPAKLVGDELRIKQILNNLLSNAFKYTDVGKVTMSVSHETDPESGELILVFVVSDTGSGMTQDQLDMLFDEYSRFNETNDRKIEGTGLGLSIMRRLVQLMSGNVHVESEPGKGTSVTIKLPQGTVNANILGKAAVEDLKQFKQYEGKGRDSKKLGHEPMPYGKVLVVDDTETNLFVAVRFLKPYKLAIETAINGRDAIEKINNAGGYDVVFMDHMMPEMDGMEATKHLREMGYDRPIVALTANAMTGQAEMFLQNGFDEFISKPIDIKLLDTVLMKLIRDKQPQEVIYAARKQKEEEKNEGNNAVSPDVDNAIMESFIYDARKAVALLEETFDKTGWMDNEDDLRRFTITVHGMKSILECINEMELSAVAKDLEVAGRAEDLGKIESDAGSFLERLKELLAKLEKEFKSNDTVSGDGTGMLCEKLQKIEELCEDFNRKEVMDIVSNVGGQLKKSSDVFEKIKELVQVSEFEEAGKVAGDYAFELSNVDMSIADDATTGVDAPVSGEKQTKSLLEGKEVTGLNIQKGLDRYDGDEGIYLKTLRAYASGTTTMLESISTFDRDKLNDYRITVHGIKGASYDINAQEHGKIAEELENAAVNEDYEYIEKHNPGFVKSAGEFIRNINGLLAKIAEENPKPKKDKPDGDLLLKLREASENYDMNEIDTVMEKLEEFMYEADEGLIERLRKHVDLMQFKQIVVALTDITN